MSDITKCKNKECVMKNFCKRHTSPSNEYRQAFSDFKPKVNKLEGFDCERFLKQ